MKKYFKFLSLITIIAIIASISVLAPMAVNAGSLTEIQVSLSSYDVSSDLDPVYVTMTAQMTLATELSGTAGDKVVITFQEYEANEENQFKIDDVALTVADVVVSCAGDVNVMDDSSLTVTDGAGIAPDKITIVMGDTTDTDTCVATSVLKVVITSSTTEIRTPYTQNDVSPAGYRIKFESTDTADALEDTGTAAVYINNVGGNQILIYGQVDPVLSMALNTNSCDLGVLSKDGFKTCGYTVTVGTNAYGGYSGYLQSDDDLNDDNTGVYITTEADSTDITYGNSGEIEAFDTVALLTGSEYGVSVFTTDTADIFDDVDGTWGNCDAIEAETTTDVLVGSLDTTEQRFAYAAVAVDATTTGITQVCHVARIAGDQASGSFTQIITVTVVGNF